MKYNFGHLNHGHTQLGWNKMSNKFILCLILLFLFVNLCGCTMPSVTTDSDNDGIIDEDDDFPDDPSASIDTDKDGYPDEWNKGMSKSDSTSIPKLSLDAFPNDSNEYVDSDGDGVGDNADSFPFDSTQWSDIDGDKHGDNPNGNEPDEFKYDPSEWKDSDHDGIGDNADIYDYGNAGIKVKINEFHCDEWFDEVPYGSPDSYFIITISEYDNDIGEFIELGRKESSAYHNELDVYDDDLYYIVDVDEKVGTVMVDIEVLDSDLDNDDIIDVNGESPYLTSINQAFYPHNSNWESYISDGRKDLEDELDGWLDYTIEIVGL